MKPSPIADQVRQLREQRFARRTQAMMTPRSAPSPAKVKEIADRAEARSSTVILPQPKSDATVTVKAGASPIIVKPNANETIVYGGGRQQGKTAKMATPAPAFDKNKFQMLYLRMRRAKTPELRTAAEAALREAFPNTRPRTNGSSANLPLREPPPREQKKIAAERRAKKVVKRSKSVRKAKKAKKKGSR
jgi:hypothetical protein